MLIEDAARLAKIDHLYSLRLDQYVSLPVVREHSLRVVQFADIL